MYVITKTVNGCTYYYNFDRLEWSGLINNATKFDERSVLIKMTTMRVRDGINCSYQRVKNKKHENGK